MTDRERLVREIYAQAIAAGSSAKWTVVNVLDAIDRAGYEVVPKRAAVEALSEVRAAFDAHDQALIDAAARKGAAMALRQWHAAAVSLYERDNAFYQAVIAQAERIEKGETP